MGVIFYKIWYDIWKNKGRTAQVVLIIAMGAAALGMIISTRSLVVPAMQDGWQSINPAMITLGMYPSIDDDELAALKNIDGIVDVEGYSTTTIEWKINPDDEWQQAGLLARADYDNQKYTKLELIDGDWPQDKWFAVEQGHEAFFKIPQSRQVYIRVNDREKLITFNGTIYNQFVQPVQFGGNAQFYVTRDYFEDLTGDRDFNNLFAGAAEWDKEIVTGYADDLQDKLDKIGVESYTNFTDRVMDPNKHFFQDSMDGLFYLLGVMGALALILGLLLVYNTINAIISQQIDQIGIMKAIGAQTGNVLGIYLLTILIYGMLALLLALPLTTFGGWTITSWLVGSFNADAGAFTVSGFAIAVTAGISLLAPLLASLLPIFAGARITVREAINTYGLSTGGGFLDKMMAKTQRISRLVLLTISNTFRKKWRVILLQITLVLSGLIFMMVVSIQDSVVYTFNDVLLGILNYDVNLVFENSERISHVEELTLNHPEVKAAEMWGFGNFTIRPQGQEETEDDESGLVFGVPLPTNLYGYQLRKGRWLVPEDTYALVLNQDLAKDAGVTVGDWVTAKQGSGKESDWRVVGLISDPLFTTSIHAPRDTLLKEIGETDRAGTVWIQTTATTPAGHAEVAKRLRTYFDENGVKVSAQRGIFGISDTSRETAQAIINQFNFIVILLGIMAVIIGAVGSIALSGALSLSVMERRREIGVMRAIGASSWTIARLFIGEGLLLGWLSWLIALPFAPFIGKVMLGAVGSAFGLDLLFKYSPVGAVMWLVIITILSVLASWFPARGAVKISVRESLAYQ